MVRPTHRPGTRGAHVHGRPNVSVDVAAVTIRDGVLQLGLVVRGDEPHKGMFALPGGYVHVDEDLTIEEVARRTFRAKAGVPPRHLEQLCSFGGVDRDPDGWSVTVAWLAMLDQAEAEASKLEFRPVDALPDLAFDHGAIAAAAVARLRDKSGYSALPAFLLPEEFTMLELQDTYERILGVRLDKASFRRKIVDQVVIETTGNERRETAYRPAALFRLAAGRGTILDRPLLR